MKSDVGTNFMNKDAWTCLFISPEVRNEDIYESENLLLY